MTTNLSAPRREFLVSLAAAWHDPLPTFQTFFATPGHYVVQPVPGPNLGRSAWNAWSGGVEQTPDGTWSKGWVTGFGISSAAFPAAPVQMVYGKRWPNARDAIQNAPEGRFDMPVAAPVTLSILDSHHDNIGGLTLKVCEYAMSPAGDTYA